METSTQFYVLTNKDLCKCYCYEKEGQKIWFTKPCNLKQSYSFQKREFGKSGLWTGLHTFSPDIHSRGAHCTISIMLLVQMRFCHLYQHNQCNCAWGISQFQMSWQNPAPSKLNVRQWIHEDIRKTEGILQYALSEQSFSEQLQSNCKSNRYQIFSTPLRSTESFHYKDNAVSSYIIQLLAEAAFVQTEP